MAKVEERMGDTMELDELEDAELDDPTYHSFIPTHLYEFVTKRSKRHGRHTPENMACYGWVRLLASYMDDMLSDLEDYRLVSARSTFRRRLRGVFFEASSETIERLCIRFVGGLVLRAGTVEENMFMIWAIRRGCLGALEHAHRLRERGITDALDIVASISRTQLKDGMFSYPTSVLDPNSIIWLIRHAYPVTDAMAHNAASRGHETLTRWLLDNYPHDMSCVKLAGSMLGGGLIEMLHEVDRVKPVVIKWAHVYPAISRGNKESIKWMLDRVGPTSDVWGPNVNMGMMSAYGLAIQTCPSTIPWMLERGIFISWDVMVAAIEMRDLPMMERMYEMRDRFVPKECDVVEDIMLAAMRCGKLSIVKWLYEHGFHFDEFEYVAAAKRGQLRIMQWLYSVGVVLKDWSKVRAEAVKRGQIEVLEWLLRAITIDR